NDGCNGYFQEKSILQRSRSLSFSTAFAAQIRLFQPKFIHINTSHNQSEPTKLIIGLFLKPRKPSTSPSYQNKVCTLQVFLFMWFWFMINGLLHVTSAVSPQKKNRKIRN
ncbi:MAG: hypothetical protein Q4G28_09275, partial [Neisseria sp.]|nr:hypothetical protein [Neisseria sp.]